MQPVGNAEWPASAIIVDMLHGGDGQPRPFSRIIEAARQVPLGESLVVIAPSEPSEAYEAMAHAGFMYETEHVGPDEWLTRFVRVGA